MNGLGVLGNSIDGTISYSIPNKQKFSLDSTYQIRVKSNKFVIKAKYALAALFLNTLISKYEIKAGLVSKLTSKYGIQSYSKHTLSSVYHVGGISKFPLTSGYSLNYLNNFTFSSRYSITLPFVKPLDSSYTIIGSTLLVNKSNSLLVKDVNRTIKVKR